MTSLRTPPRLGSTRSGSTARFYARLCGVSFGQISWANVIWGVAGVNLLIGTEHGLMLLDRSGQGKVYQLISRRRFQQMEVLEGQNILVTISGKKNRVRVYYLSWLKSKILRTDGVSDVSFLPGGIGVFLNRTEISCSKWRGGTVGSTLETSKVLSISR
jgi:hypothetical protein